MFKKVMMMVVMMMVMVVMTCTMVQARPSYYCDTPEGREERRQMSILETKYWFSEALYEEEEFSDEKVELVYDEETNLYTLTASWKINNSKDSVGMCAVYFDDDYEIGDIKNAYMYINGKLAMTQKGEDDVEWTEYGQGYKEALGYEEEE